MHVSGGYLAQQALNGLSVGSFYSLLAVAYALVHTITNRVILSFGDFMTFGAFSAIMAVLVAAGFGGPSAAGRQGEPGSRNDLRDGPAHRRQSDPPHTP